MSTRTVSQRRLASSLSLLLVSCSATRSAAPAPAGAQELSRYVLVIEEAPGGQVTHSWQPAGDFDLSHYQHLPGTSGFNGRLVLAGLFEQKCDAEGEACEQRCKASRTVYQVDKYVYDKSLHGPWSKGKYRYCREACMKLEAECLRRGQAVEAQRFDAIDDAVDWLKRHRTESLVGTVIVIAGVAFVAAVVGSGGGVLVLAPALLLVSSEPPPGFQVVAAEP